MKLSIKNFHLGKTSSPYTTDGAFWKSQNLDIHGQEGIARINYKPTQVTSTSPVLNKLTHSFASLSGVGGTMVFVDQSGTVKTFSPPNTMSNVGTSPTTYSGYYVAVWKGYVIANSSTTIKASLIAAGMDNAWKDISSGLENITSHQMLVSTKDPKKIFICNDNKVAILEEPAGKVFDPDDGTTFDIGAGNLAALTLDSKYRVQSIEEFGRYLAIFIEVKSHDRTLIMLWDRETATTVEEIIEIKEPKMVGTLEHEGIIYITGGRDGNIYTLTPSGIKHHAQIKIGDIDNRNNLAYQGGIDYGIGADKPMAIWKDRLMVVINNQSPYGLTPTGIYSVKDGKVNHEFLPSAGDGSSFIRLGAIAAIDDYLIWGWTTASTTSGLDFVRDDNDRATSYNCYFETPLLRAGAKLQKNSISRIEAILARPLQTDEGVRIKYRKNINDSWTTLGTKDFATNGAQSSLVFPGIPNIENIQLKVEMTTGAASKNTPYLQELILF